MSQQWRILVAEGDEYLNQGIVNALLKDGYNVQGVLTGAEAIRILWADEQNLVIGDLQLPDADGFDLLQWIRTYCPQTRMIMLASSNVPEARTRALENGAVGYLEKPVDLRLLKVEVRRLIQQTGFTASLASFDLLDVIQIVNMSRKSIALVVHTGLEEQGMLGFQAGELIWAEYGMLRGEEAFFALAAHKNGMVTQQPWNDRVAPNVTQPLSRLIMQALQYRSKYAAAQQLSGEHAAQGSRLAAPFENGQSPLDTVLTEEVDDRPFTYVAGQPPMVEPPAAVQPAAAVAEAREWWQDSAKTPGMQRSGKMRAATASSPAAPPSAPVPHGQEPAPTMPAPSNGSSIMPSTVRKTSTGQRSDLPSWLMDQPTQFEIPTPAMRPSSLTGSGQIAVAPPVKSPPSVAEWRPNEPVRTALPVAPAASIGQAAPVNGKSPHQAVVEAPRQAGAAVWQEPQNPRQDALAAAGAPLSGLQSLVKPRQTDELRSREHTEANAKGAIPATPLPTFAANEHVVLPTQVERPSFATSTRQQSATRRNYPALVSALQTLGYTLPGFIASAVIGMDGLPIAQVAVEDLDISAMCGDFSSILRNARLVLQRGSWAQHEDTIITSATHHIVLRVLDSTREVFQVLITTRESDPVESLESMATVESAIVAAL